MLTQGGLEPCLTILGGGGFGGPAHKGDPPVSVEEEVGRGPVRPASIIHHYRRQGDVMAADEDHLDAEVWKGRESLASPPSPPPRR